MRSVAGPGVPDSVRGWVLSWLRHVDGVVVGAVVESSVHCSSQPNSDCVENLSSLEGTWAFVVPKAAHSAPKHSPCQTHHVLAATPVLLKGLLCLRAQTPLRLRTARACVILRSSTVRPTCPATAAPPGASRTTRHTVTATVVAGGKHIVLVDGVKTALDKLGEVIGHRGEKEMGPVGLPQGLRVRGLAHAVLCLECLAEKGPTALIALWPHTAATDVCTLRSSSSQRGELQHSVPTASVTHTPLTATCASAVVVARAGSIISALAPTLRVGPLPLQDAIERIVGRAAAIGRYARRWKRASRPAICKLLFEERGQLAFPRIPTPGDLDEAKAGGHKIVV